MYIDTYVYENTKISLLVNVDNVVRVRMGVADFISILALSYKIKTFFVGSLSNRTNNTSHTSKKC